MARVQKSVISACNLLGAPQAIVHLSLAICFPAEHDPLRDLL